MKMKKISVLLVLIATASMSYAQKLDQSKIPSAVKASFSKHYPGLIANWEKEDGKFEASFKLENNLMSAMFEPTGTFIDSEVGIKVTDLSPAILSYVKEHYKEKSIKEGARITKADDSVNFEAEVDGKDLIFDASGKFIKETKD